LLSVIQQGKDCKTTRAQRKVIANVGRQLEWCDARCRLAAANTLVHLAVIVVADFTA
jgi:hypothetical protein